MSIDLTDVLCGDMAIEVTYNGSGSIERAWVHMVTHNSGVNIYVTGSGKAFPCLQIGDAAGGSVLITESSSPEAFGDACMWLTKRSRVSITENMMQEVLDKGSLDDVTDILGETLRLEAKIRERRAAKESK
jgi:hypothetical protein